MKWARVVKNPTEQSSGTGDQAYKNDQISFRDYTSEAELKADIGNEENQWFNYKFSYDYGQQVKTDYNGLDPAETNNKITEYIESFKKRYEAFCGGYLFFYDVVIRSATLEHVIHFNWETVSDEKGITDFSVTVFISPAPARSIADNSDAQQSKQQGAGANRQKTGKLTSKDYSTAFTGVDPPEPPPPPPPSMH